MDDLLTILLVVGLLAVVTVGVVALVSVRMSNVTVENGQWEVYPESANLSGTNNTFQIGNAEISLEAITAVDKFYNPKGEWGVIGVRIVMENNGTQTITLPLKDAYFVNSHGKRVDVEIKVGNKRVTPNDVSIPSKSKFEISLVAKNSERDIVIGKTPVHLVTLLAKEGHVAYFSLPWILNGRETHYTFKIKFISR